MQPVSSRAGTLIQVQTQTITGIKTTDTGVGQPGLSGLTTQRHARSGWPFSLRAGASLSGMWAHEVPASEACCE